MDKGKKDLKSLNRSTPMKKSAKTKNDSKRLGGGEKWPKKSDKKNLRNLLKPR